MWCGWLKITYLCSCNFGDQSVKSVSVGYRGQDWFLLEALGRILFQDFSRSFWLAVSFDLQSLSCCCCLVAQSCPTLCDPMHCSPPGSSIHGIFQARILEWVAISFSRELPDPRVKPRFPSLHAGALPSEPPGKPPGMVYLTCVLFHHAHSCSSRDRAECSPSLSLLHMHWVKMSYFPIANKIYIELLFSNTCQESLLGK